MPIEVTRALHQPVERIAGRTLTPERVTVRVQDDEDVSPYDLELEIRVLHGRPICALFQATQREGGPPITRKGLNGTRVEELLRRALTGGAAGPLMQSTSIGGGQYRVSPLSRADAAKAFKQTQPARGRRADPAARQQKVERAAGMYCDLIEAGVRHPKPVIAKQLHLSASYVGALIGEARKQGLVPASPGPGRASVPAEKRASRGRVGTPRNPKNSTPERGQA